VVGNDEFPSACSSVKEASGSPDDDSKAIELMCKSPCNSYGGSAVVSTYDFIHRHCPDHRTSVLCT
jgi:hypothetical protein